MCIDGVTGLVASLISPSSAECEWGSMMPGVSHIPLASTNCGRSRRVDGCAHARDFAGMHPHRAVLDGAVTGRHHRGILENDVTAVAADG